MKRLTRARCGLLGLGVVLLAVAALAPPGGAAAQPQPTIVLSPASGPCDAVVEVAGTGFLAGAEIPLDLGGAHSDVAIGRLGVATAGPDGKFSVTVTFGALGCEVAARDAEVSHPGEALAKSLVIFAGYDPARESILTQAAYSYTTTAPSIARALPPAGDGSAVAWASRPTAVSAGLASAAAQPQPTMVLSPSSGPCDATVDITGQDFPANAEIELGVGGTDGQSPVGRLGSAMSDGQGRFSSSTLLGFWGCDMASVTKDRIGGDQLWLLGYVLEPGPSGPTARVLTRAAYTFTTTESTLPVAILTLSPSSGPCDATVEATGTLFEPGSDVTLQVARPSSEGYMGTLGQVRTDANGGFVTTLTLGTVGCEAAALHAAPGEPNELQVCGAAYQASRCAKYAYTTTAATPGSTLIALPRAGQGPGQPSAGVPWVALIAAVAGLAVMLVAASFCARRVPR